MLFSVLRLCFCSGGTWASPPPCWTLTGCALLLQAYQHWYLGLLYSLLAIKSILVDDFTSLANGNIGSVRLSKLTPSEQVVFWGGKVVWAAWFVVLPLTRGSHSVVGLVGLWLLAQAVTGWTLAFMFQVSTGPEAIT